MSDPERSRAWRRRAKGYGCLLMVFIALPFALLKSCQILDQHPTDQAMISEFKGNRTAFSALLNMIREEPRVSRVADDFIWIDGAHNVDAGNRKNYLSDERLARYRALFDELHLESGVVRREDGSVGFLRSSSGMVTSGLSKEFIWSPNLIKSALKATDQRGLEDACLPKGACSSVRPIAPEWYIAFDSN